MNPHPALRDGITVSTTEEGGDSERLSNVSVALIQCILEPRYHVVSSGSWEDVEHVLCVKEGWEMRRVSSPQIPKGLKVKRTFKGVHRVI